jgi:hypothetical protein
MCSARRLVLHARQDDVASRRLTNGYRLNPHVHKSNIVEYIHSHATKTCIRTAAIEQSRMRPKSRYTNENEGRHSKRKRQKQVNITAVLQALHQQGSKAGSGRRKVRFQKRRARYLAGRARMQQVSNVISIQLNIRCSHDCVLGIVRGVSVHSDTSEYGINDLRDHTTAAGQAQRYAWHQSSTNACKRRK